MHEEKDLILLEKHGHTILKGPELEHNILHLTVTPRVCPIKSVYQKDRLHLVCLRDPMGLSHTTEGLLAYLVNSLHGTASWNYSACVHLETDQINGQWKFINKAKLSVQVHIIHSL